MVDELLSDGFISLRRDLSVESMFSRHDTLRPCLKHLDLNCVTPDFGTVCRNLFEMVPYAKSNFGAKCHLGHGSAASSSCKVLLMCRPPFGADHINGNVLLSLNVDFSTSRSGSPDTA